MPVKRCGCEHKWMDQKYGKGKRIFNEVKGQQGMIYRCTVCGKDSGSISRGKR